MKGTPSGSRQDFASKFLKIFQKPCRQLEFVHYLGNLVLLWPSVNKTSDYYMFVFSS